MRELVHSSGILMLRQLLTAGVSLVRIKIVAVVLGPNGMGVLAQANQLQLFLDRVVNLGIGAGASKFTSEYYSREQFKQLEKFIGELMALLLMSGVTLAFLSTLFAPQLAAWIFASSERSHFVILVAVALPMLAQSTVVSFVLRGTLKFRGMLHSGVASAVAALVLTIPLVLLYKLNGAIWSITLSAAASFLVHWFILRKHLLKPMGLHPRIRLPNRESVVNLSKYGLVNLIGQVSTALSELLIRSSVILVLGAVANGLYQVAWSVSNQLYGIIVAALFGYGMPKLAAIGDDPVETSRTYNDLFKAYLILIVPIGAAALVFARGWIPILFSSDFLAAESILPWQFAAQAVFGFRVVLNAGLLVREHFKAFIVFTLLQSVLHIGFYFLLLPYLQIDAVPVAILLSHLIVGVPNYLFLARIERLILRARVRLLSWSSLAAILIYTSAFLLFPESVAIVVTSAVIAVWLLFNVRKGDMEDLVRVMKSGPIE